MSASLDRRRSARSVAGHPMDDAERELWAKVYAAEYGRQALDAEGDSGARHDASHAAADESVSRLRWRQRFQASGLCGRWAVVGELRGPCSRLSGHLASLGCLPSEPLPAIEPV